MMGDGHQRKMALEFLLRDDSSQQKNSEENCFGGSLLGNWSAPIHSKALEGTPQIHPQTTHYHLPVEINVLKDEIMRELRAEIVLLKAEVEYLRQLFVENQHRETRNPNACSKYIIVQYVFYSP